MQTLTSKKFPINSVLPKGRIVEIDSAFERGDGKTDIRIRVASVDGRHSYVSRTVPSTDISVK